MIEGHGDENRLMGRGVRDADDVVIADLNTQVVEDDVRACVGKVCAACGYQKLERDSPYLSVFGSLCALPRRSVPIETDRGDW